MRKKLLGFRLHLPQETSPDPFPLSKCSHGATNSPISEEELFYLKARGIRDGEARRLIATGFIEDVIGTLKDEALIAELNNRIEAKLAG